MSDYLEHGMLPQGDKEARKIVLSSGQYTLEDSILYGVEDDRTLQVVLPVWNACFSKLMEEGLEHISVMPRR